MKTEHRALIAIALSAAFFILWSVYINPQKKPENTQSGTQAVEQKNKETSASTAASAAKLEKTSKSEDPRIEDPQSSVRISTVALKNNLIEATISNDGGVVKSWRVNNYRETTDAKSPPTDLATSEEDLPAPLASSFGLAGIPDSPRFEIIESSDAKIVMRWRSPKVEITKTITLEPESYVANVAIELQNRSSEPIVAQPALKWSGVNLIKKDEGFFSKLKGQQPDVKQPVYLIDGKVHRVTDTQKLEKPAIFTGAVYWAGLENRYFLTAIVPRVQGENLAVEYGNAGKPAEAASSLGLWAGAAFPSTSIPSGEKSKADFSVYAGPKEISLLKALNVRLDEAIDYGWFTVIAIPILYLLKFFYNIINNYGVAIILLTIFVKLLLHPINVKSLKSMKAMQQLQPQLKELQQKYKGDKQKLNMETMQMFRAHKVNPMSGCLPMVLQLPIYIALYKVLWSSIELYHAPFFWFYRDLSAPDPYLITPILLGIFMVGQQMLTPSASADPAQKKMMMFMPVAFTAFMLFLPVGLVIYILVNTAMSVTQQWMYNKGIGFMDIVRGKLHMKTA